jgi:hypothetical protein
MPSRNLTLGQKNGLKFEVWVEQLFNDLNYVGVRRNVLYQKDNGIYRQVDVEFNDYSALNPLTYLNSLVIVELKYSSGRKVSLNLRNGKKLRRKKKGPNKGKGGQRIRTIDNIVNETEERRKFVGARRAILATNYYFCDNLYREAEKYGRIKLYDLDDLQKLDQKRTGILSRLRKRKKVDQQINGVRLRKDHFYVVRETINEK